MRERLNLRIGRSSGSVVTALSPPPSFSVNRRNHTDTTADATVPPVGYSFGNTTAASSPLSHDLVGDMTNVSLSSARNGAPAPVTESDVLDQQSNYVSRILALAKQTVSHLFSNDGEADFVGSPGDAADRQPGTRRVGEEDHGEQLPPQHTQFQPPPPLPSNPSSFAPHPVDLQPMDGPRATAAPAHPQPPPPQQYAYPHQGRPSEYEAYEPADYRPGRVMTGVQGYPYYSSTPHEAPVMAAAPRPASMLSRGADNTLTSAAPNVTVYQFFNSPSSTEPRGVSPAAWYGRHDYSFSASRPTRAVVDVRPTLQYKRYRAQDEELRQLQAPPLQLRERRTVTEPQPAEKAPARAEAAPIAPPRAEEPKPTAPMFGGANATMRKSGPLAVAPVDSDKSVSGRSSDEVQEKTPAPKPESKPSFSFSMPAPAAAATTSAPPPQAQGTMASPFSFGAPATAESKSAGPTTATTAATTAAPKAAPATLSFGSPAATTTAAAAKPSFGSSTTSTGANPFFKAGPPAVIPEDDGFATDSEDDDAEKKDEAPAKKDAPAVGSSAPKPMFSFGNTSGSAAPASSSAAPSNPFSFGSGGSGTSMFGAPSTAASPPPPPAATAPKAAAPAPSGGFGGFVKAGPPAVIPTDDGFASDAEDSDDDAKGTAKKTKTEEAPAGPKKIFSFGLGSGTDGGNPPPNPFSFGSGGSGSTFGKPADSSGAAPAFSFFQKK